MRRDGVRFPPHHSTYFLREGHVELCGEGTPGGEPTDGDGVGVDVQVLHRRPRPGN